MLIVSLIFCNCVFKDKEQECAEMLIQRIESFKEKNNRLPKDITELGITKIESDNSIFYQMETDSTYTIWYGLGLGNSNVYGSSTKKWNEAG